MNKQISQIANNYANGIIDYSGNDVNISEKILHELQEIHSTLKQAEDLNEILTTPVVDINKKSEIIESVFGSEFDIHTRNLLKILVEKSRFKELEGIISALSAKIMEIKGEQEIVITSAIQLDSETRTRIVEKLETKLQKKVLPQWKEDNRIIGGLVIEIGDCVIDMSLQNRLESMSKIF